MDNLLAQYNESLSIFLDYNRNNTFKEWGTILKYLDDVVYQLIEYFPLRELLLKSLKYSTKIIFYIVSLKKKNFNTIIWLSVFKHKISLYTQRQIYIQDNCVDLSILCLSPVISGQFLILFWKWKIFLLLIFII